MEIIGFHVKNKTIANSKGDIIQNPPYLKWLLKHQSNSIQVVYDLQNCIEPLLNIIGINSRDRVNLLTSTELITKFYQFRYIPDKFFSIKRNNHHLSYFCNISQYFPENDKDLLKVLKSESDIEYCVRVANVAKNIGIEVYNTFQEMGLNVSSLSSLNRIYENNKSSEILQGKEYEDFKKMIYSKIQLNS